MHARFPPDGQKEFGPARSLHAPSAEPGRDPAACLHHDLCAAVGSEKYSEILYCAGYRSARHWCAKEARVRGLAGVAMLEHYLCRLSRRGWGAFSIVEVNTEIGAADIRLDCSTFVLAQADVCATRTCRIFAGWFAGTMDWIHAYGWGPAAMICCQTQCGAKGHDHCLFAVRMRAKC